MLFFFLLFIFAPFDRPDVPISITPDSAPACPFLNPSIASRDAVRSHEAMRTQKKSSETAL